MIEIIIQLLQRLRRMNVFFAGVEVDAFTSDVLRHAKGSHAFADSVFDDFLESVGCMTAELAGVRVV